MPTVSDLDLPEIDLGSGELASDGYHRRLAGQGEMAGQIAAIDPADIAAVAAAVRDVTGRPARTFEQWAQAHADSFADPG